MLACKGEQYWIGRSLQEGVTLHTVETLLTVFLLSFTRVMVKLLEQLVSIGSAARRHPNHLQGKKQEPKKGERQLQRPLD